jgi:hypothetical protein
VGEYQGYVETDERVLPTSVRALRVLLYAGAAVSLLLTVGALTSGNLDAETAGLLVWAVWPGFVALFLARRIGAGGRRRFWSIVVVAAAWVLGALGSIGNGDPRGITNLILPIAVLVALTRRTSRDFFLR